MLVQLTIFHAPRHASDHLAMNGVLCIVHVDCFCTAKFYQYDGPQLQQKSNSNGGWKRGLEPKCKVNNYCVIALSENYSITFFDGCCWCCCLVLLLCAVMLSCLVLLLCLVRLLRLVLRLCLVVSGLMLLCRVMLLCLVMLLSCNVVVSVGPRALVHPGEAVAKHGSFIPN